MPTSTLNTFPSRIWQSKLRAGERIALLIRVKTFVRVEVHMAHGLNSAPNSPEIHKAAHYMVHAGHLFVDIWMRRWYANSWFLELAAMA